MVWPDDAFHRRLFLKHMMLATQAALLIIVVIAIVGVVGYLIDKGERQHTQKD